MGTYTSLTALRFIEKPVSSQESERSRICVLVVAILPLSTILLLKFGTVPTAWYFLFFHFIMINKISLL